MATAKLLILMVLIKVASASYDPSLPYYLLFQNRLPGQLNVHCVTKNNDLRLHPMPPGADYKFFFKLNFWLSTSFHCRFNYVGTNMWQAFETWRGPGFWFKDSWPCRQCTWMVNPDGFFRAQENETLVMIWPWRRDPEKYLVESKLPESP
ncbi:hypothetical protein KC19_3G228500 [Ceratodon purpureus]|uniref:S-protein homolog n=1 Tax=Ceratodon purpureus TaxID=3225 RepID=A0A8T0INW3_CERPU|nr:hypothetical protein KC19_3G228500 [Ceratodon purpureus]